MPGRESLAGPVAAETLLQAGDEAFESGSCPRNRPVLAALFMACLFATLSVLGVGAAFGSGVALADGDPKLPAAGYAKALREFKTLSADTDDLDVAIRVIPDLYRYDMAVGIEEIQKSGFKGRRLEKELKKLHKKAWRKRELIGLEYSLQNSSSKNHFFLQTRLTNHIDVDGKRVKVSAVRDAEPGVRLRKWTVFAGPATQKVSLQHFEKLGFTAELKVPDRTEPLTVILENLLRYVPVEKKSPYAKGGIDIGVRQITIGHFDNMKYPSIEQKLYPGKWEMPEAPEGFEALLKSLQ